jgi:hypothetical protein
MKALCVCVIGVVYAVAGTAAAETVTGPRPHPAKKPTVEAGVPKAAGVTGIGLSDAYGSPVPAAKTMIARFSAIRPKPPVDPQGGFSLSVGRDSPDAPFTGGLKFRF